jgi:c-di-GMP-binding flagellar brake protein YcgR
MGESPRKPQFLVTQYQFDDMHVRVGDRFQLESPAHSAERHYGTLVGFSLGQSVLVKTPFVDGLPLPYTDGQALTARAFTGKGIFAFDTSVQRVCVSPFHYMHLSFPLAVRGVQIRASERVKITLPTRIQLPGGTEEPAMLTDIGVGGAMLECGHRLHPGNRLTVQLRFALEEMNLTAGFSAEAVVHRAVDAARPDQAVPVRAYGLEFSGLTTGQMVMLQNFVYHHLLQGHHLLI